MMTLRRSCVSKGSHGRHSQIKHAGVCKRRTTVWSAPSIKQPTARQHCNIHCPSKIPTPRPQRQLPSHAQPAWKLEAARLQKVPTQEPIFPSHSQTCLLASRRSRTSLAARPQRRLQGRLSSGTFEIAVAAHGQVAARHRFCCRNHVALVSLPPGPAHHVPHRDPMIKQAVSRYLRVWTTWRTTVKTHWPMPLGFFLCESLAAVADSQQALAMRHLPHLQAGDLDFAGDLSHPP